MSGQIWSRLGGPQRMLLIGCAVIIAMGSAILLIDRLFIREPALPVSQSLPPIAEGLGMSLDVDAADRTLLLEVLNAMPGIAGEVVSIEAVMRRGDADHRLWVFEFKAREVVMISPNRFTPLQQHSAGITRLGIVLELSGASLPAWQQTQPEPPPAPPWTTEADGRHGAIEDLLFGFSGSYVVALARPDRFPLGEMVARNTSPEFHPGLLNSALAIDVQRVLDVVNRMQTGAPELARVYQLDVDVKLPPVAKPEISSRLSGILREQELAREERHKQQAEQRAQFQADLEAQSVRNQERFSNMLEQSRARSEQARAEREAARAANAAKLAESLAQSRARTDAMIQELQARTAASIAEPAVPDGAPTAAEGAGN
jgi:hypothetical protein